MPFQIYAMRDTLWQIFLIMCHHNQSLVLSLTESVYYVFHQLSLFRVQAMQRFIKYKQLRIFHESPCQQYHTLFSA